MTIIYVLIAGFAVLLIFISQQPDDFVVTRSAPISAPAAGIFPHVNNLHNWQAWSPWSKLDPNAKSTFEGATEGVGAILRWDSNSNKVGKGSMEIIESRPSEYIKLKLIFIKPMSATNNSEFNFRANGDQTIVTWSMSGKNSFVGKAMNLIMDCDTMVGDQFEKGLSDLKKVAENK